MKRAGLGVDAALKAAANLVALVENRLVGNAVKDVQPLFSPSENPGFAQRLELAGRVRLGLPGESDEGGDIFFPPSKAMMSFSLLASPSTRNRAAIISSASSPMLARLFMGCWKRR